MKKMKMMLVILAAAALLFAAYAFAQDQVLDGDGMVNEPALSEENAAAEVVDITGVITAIGDGYVMILNELIGEVQVNLAEDTVIEGVEALEIGQAVVVMYNGMMTRSLPPQITAMHIGVYAVDGVVAAAEEGSIVILRGDTGEEVIVSLPQGAEAPAEGENVVAYTTGAMTMSLPPQMNAIAVFSADATPSEAAQ